jgi:hypothetical protein
MLLDVALIVAANAAAVAWLLVHHVRERRKRRAEAEHERAP